MTDSCLHWACGQSQELRKSPKSFVTLASDEISKRTPKILIFGTSKWESKFTCEIAVKPVNTWRFPLWLSSGRMPLSRSFLTEPTRVSYRRGTAQAWSKMGGKYAIWERELHGTWVKSAHTASCEWRESGGVRAAQNKLTSYKVIIIPARGYNRHVHEPAYRHMVRPLQSVGPKPDKRRPQNSSGLKKKKSTETKWN